MHFYKLQPGQEVAKSEIDNFHIKYLFAAKKLQDDFSSKKISEEEYQLYQDTLNQIKSKLIKPYEKLLLKTNESEIEKAIDLEKKILNLVLNEQLNFKEATSKNGIFVDIGEIDKLNDFSGRVKEFYPQINLQILHESKEDNRVGITANSLFNAIYTKVKSDNKACNLKEEKRDGNFLERKLELGKKSMFNSDIINLSDDQIIELINQNDIDHSIDPLKSEENNRSLLALAIFYGNEKLVKIICAKYAEKYPHMKGCLIPIKDKSGRNILHIACETNKNTNIIMYLMNNFAEFSIKSLIEDKDNFSNAPLHIACAFSSKEMVIELLKYSDHELANLNQNGFNCLHMACFKSNLSVIELLLDVVSWRVYTQKDRSGRTPLDLAMELGNLQVVDILKEKSSKLNVNTQRSAKQELPIKSKVEKSKDKKAPLMPVNKLTQEKLKNNQIKTKVTSKSPWWSKFF